MIQSTGVMIISACYDPMDPMDPVMILTASYDPMDVCYDPIMIISTCYDSIDLCIMIQL